MLETLTPMSVSDAMRHVPDSLADRFDFTVDRRCAEAELRRHGTTFDVFAADYVDLDADAVPASLIMFWLGY